MINALLVSFTFIVGFFSSMPSATAAEAKAVKVCLPAFREELLTLAVLTAQEQGYFKKQGLRIDFEVSGPVDRDEQEVESAKPKLNLAKSDRKIGGSVAEGGCDFGTSNVSMYFVAADSLLENTQPLMMNAYDKTYDTNLVVSAKSNIKTVADLKGKRIRMGQTPNRLAVQNVLKEADLGLKDVVQVYGMDATEVIAKLDSGEIDAAITYLPTMPYMLASGKVRVLKQNLLSGYAAPAVPHSLLVVNRDYASAYPENVKKFVAAVQQGTEYLRRNPSSSIFMLNKNSRMLRTSAWKVDKVTAERSAAFFGDFTTMDLSQKEARAKASRQVAEFRQIMMKAGFLEKEANDLSSWL